MLVVDIAFEVGFIILLVTKERVVRGRLVLFLYQHRNITIRTEYNGTLAPFNRHNTGVAYD